MASTVKPIPDGYTAVTPYLNVRGAAKAIDFYKEVFGANERMRMETPDGKITHAEIAIGSSVIMLHDENPQLAFASPQRLGGTSAGVMLYVDDVDATIERAKRAGAKVTMEASDQFYGDRAGDIIDPFGHKWMIATHVKDVSPQELTRRAKESYGAVFTGRTRTH